MPLKMTGAQWRAFMKDKLSWPEGSETYIEEYLLDHNGVETEDLDDALVKDDDVIVVKSGWVRAPEEGSKILGSFDFEEWAKASLRRQLTVSRTLDVDRDRLAEFTESAKKCGIRTSAPSAKVGKAPTSVTLTGREWKDYLALEPPEWPRDGYVCDCFGTIDGAPSDDVSAGGFSPESIVKVDGGAIILPDNGQEDLATHLAAWLRSRQTVGVVASTHRDKTEDLERLAAEFSSETTPPTPSR